MTRVLVINGHPDSESFCAALAAAYATGARSAGAEVVSLRIADLSFNPSLEHGYRKRTELEPCLLDAWEEIKRADHLVWVFPTWWGGLPALLKGFIDRVFLPGFAFKYHGDDLLPEQLLKGKSARLITTMDAPGWYYRLVYRSLGTHQLKRAILNFCGVAPVRTTLFASVKDSSPARRALWLAAVESLGTRRR